MSPPAFVWNPYLTLSHMTLTHVTFDLQVKSQFEITNGSKDMDFFLVFFFSSELLSSDFWYSYRQTDRQTDGKGCISLIRVHRALAQVGSKTDVCTCIRILSHEPGPTDSAYVFILLYAIPPMSA